MDGGNRNDLMWYVMYGLPESQTTPEEQDSAQGTKEIPLQDVDAHGAYCNSGFLPAHERSKLNRSQGPPVRGKGLRD